MERTTHSHECQQEAHFRNTGVHSQARQAASPKLKVWWRQRLYEDMGIELARANYRMLMERTLPPRVGG